MLYGTLLDDGQQVAYEIKPGRVAYVHIARGEISLNGEELAAGDGANVDEEPLVKIAGRSSAEVLLFDLPAAPA